MHIHVYETHIGNTFTKEEAGLPSSNRAIKKNFLIFQKMQRLNCAQQLNLQVAHQICAMFRIKAYFPLYQQKISTLANCFEYILAFFLFFYTLYMS